MIPRAATLGQKPRIQKSNPSFQQIGEKFQRLSWRGRDKEAVPGYYLIKLIK
jgi:hypothetical protein